MLRDVLRDNGLAPATVARVSQTATAVRWASHGLGVTLVPTSAVLRGFEHLTRPVLPASSMPTVAAIRPGAGPAEMALLGFLRQETWHYTAFSDNGPGPGPAHNWGVPPSTANSAPVV